MGYGCAVPEILREKGFTVHIYLKDHEPPHVHVFYGDGEVKIRLGDEQTHPSFERIWRMKDKDSVRALILVDKHKDRLLNAWRDLYG